MELFSILCFVTLAKCSKFYEAAETLHLSQSSFSKHIQLLERELGTTLFIRNPHGSELTSAGMALLPYAESIIREYDKAENLINAYRKNYKNRLVVYTHSFLVHYQLSEMLLCFQNLNAGAQVEINELESRAVLQQLKANKEYIGIIFSETDSAFEEFDQYTLMEDEMVLLVSRQHPFVEQDRVHITQLRNEELQIMLKEQETFLYAFILSQCKKAGFQPRLSPHGLWISTIRDLLIRDNIVSIIPRRIAHSMSTPETKILDIEGAEPFSIKVIKNKKNASDIVNVFFDFIKRYKFIGA